MRYLLGSAMTILTLSGPAAAQMQPFGADPQIVALDGVGLNQSTADAVEGFGPAQRLVDLFDLDQERATSYVAAALSEAWGYTSCTAPADCDIVEIPWNGDLSDGNDVRRAIDQAKAVLVEAAIGGSRAPIVLVAHSWGTILAHVALSELDQEGFSPDAVTVVAALGSPIGAQCANPIRLAVLATEAGTPGARLIGNEQAAIPATAATWLNVWTQTDILSGPVETADQNLRTLSGGDVDCGFRDLTRNSRRIYEAHLSYLEQELPSVTAAIIQSLDDRTSRR